MSEPGRVAVSGDALDRLRAASAAAPGESAVRGRLAQALLREGVAAAKAGNRPRAREFFEELSKLTPDDERAWLWRASVAATVSEATTFLTRVLAIVPDHPQARAALERLRTRANGTASAPPVAGPGSASLSPASPDTPAAPPSPARSSASSSESLSAPSRSPEPALAVAAVGDNQPAASPAPVGEAAAAEAATAASEASPAAECLDTGTPAMARGVPAAAGDTGVPAAREPDPAPEPDAGDESDVESDWTGESDPALAPSETPALFVAPQTIRSLPDIARSPASAISSHAAPLSAAVPRPAAPLHTAPPSRTLAPLPARRSSLAETTAAPPDGVPATAPTPPRLVVVAGGRPAPLSPSTAAERPVAAAPGSILNLSRVSPPPRREPAPPSPPAAPPAPAATAPRAPAAAAAAAEDPPRGLVLVVDDSPTVTKVLDHELRTHKLEVVSASNGPDALKLLKSRLPDLVLLDINMPGMDGYQVCRAIRADERTRRIPVVMLSGKDGFFDKVRGRMAGAADYITKPFEPPRLVSMIAKYFPVRL